MDLSQYRGNSNAVKQPQNDIPEREPVEHIASGKMVNDSLGRKIWSEIIVEDLHSIGSYLLKEVALPAAKNAVSDLVTNFVDMALFGQARSQKSFGSSNSVRRITPYSSISSSNSVKRLSTPNVDAEKHVNYRSPYSVQDVLIPFSMDEPHNVTKAKAQEALATLRMRLSRYGFVSVADFYETVLNEVPNDIQDHKWGWYDLNGAYIQQSRDGFILRVPKNVEPLD